MESLVIREVQGLCLALRERAAAADVDPSTAGRCAVKPSTRQQTVAQFVIIIVRDNLYLGKFERDICDYYEDTSMTMVITKK